MKPAPEPALAPLQRHPFSWLPEAGLKPLFFASLALTALLMAAIHVTNAPLENPVACWGIVSLQLAGTLAKAQAILASWDARAQLYAALNLGIDYLYMFAYAATLSLACLLMARRLVQRAPTLARLGVWLAWGMLAALFLDALENYLQIRLLLGDQQERWAMLARACALPKYALVLAALLYLAAAGLRSLAKPAKRR